jgi:hypothetical protein
MTAERTPVQMIAVAVGAVFLLVGVLGFIPGITTHYGDLKFAGHSSNAELLGLFEVSILHNVVHLLFGIAGLVLARTWNGARTYLVGGGVIYLDLRILGLANGATWLPANNADDWLHFGLGVGLLALGVLSTRHRSTAGAPRTA